ncbi:MAG: HEAT repeat domain-containing protein [Planctomycetota bacterium]
MRRILLLLIASAAVADEETPKSLGAAMDAYNVATKDGDTNARVGMLAAMPELYPKAEEAVRKDAVKLVGKAAGAKDDRVRHGAFATLARFKAKGSSKYLKKWLKPPNRFKGEIPQSYKLAIEAVGEIADAGTIASLWKLTDHTETEIATAALLAFGGYHTLPTKRRKSLAFDLVKVLKFLAAPPGRRSRGGAEEIARKAALAAACIGGLQRLTGKSYQTADAWLSWQERAARQADPFK